MKLLQRLKKMFGNKIELILDYNEELSHLIQAGSDFLLMPSKYEPCGLSQMYAMKYGTIPIVRSVGGLEDSIINISENEEDATGFKFTNFKGCAIL